MKKTLLLFVFILFSFVSIHASDVEPETIVYQWNDLHNNQRTDLFKDLYGSDVLYYGKYRPGSYCAKQKARFLTPDFQQELRGKIVTTYYSGGTIKCAFTKKVTFRQMVKKHACYLLLREIDGQLRVTGESDLETDKRLGVQLDLGSVVSTTNKSKTIVVWISLAIVAGGLLVWYLTRKRANEALAMEEWVNNLPHSRNEDAHPVPITPTLPIKNTEEDIVAKVKAAVLEEIKVTTAQEPTNKDKGDAFEKYVVERFDKEYFQVEEWRSDKYHEGHYAMSSLLPDLEFSFKTKYNKARFAVECKWRAEFKDGRIDWAKDRQIRTYKDYARRERIPVFVIIGLGGSPDNPESLYILPIKNVFTNALYEKDLKRFYRYSKGNFYFNPDAGTLS